jgi:hypothetical protein
VAALLAPDSRPFSRDEAIWMTVSFALLAGLSALPPQLETHKQFTLLAIALVQLLERRIIERFPMRGKSYVLLLKTLLATILIAHTGEVGMNSDYFFAYYLPVATAAFYCGYWVTMSWTLFASAAYCWYLYPVARYEATSKDLRYLALRIMSLFLVAMVVNRFSRFKHSRNSASRSAV